MGNERISLDEAGIPAERQFYTIGFVAQMINQPTHFIVRLARDAGVGPAYLHNGVPTFDGKAVERMVEWMNAAIAVAEEHTAAAPNN